ncbi:MAG: hypothetical protein P4L16_01945 [Chlamydiales bacterium]|nr:hypothetical protein [Chlamydiales bacterium]
MSSLARVSTSQPALSSLKSPDIKRILDKDQASSINNAPKKAIDVVADMLLSFNTIIIDFLTAAETINSKSKASDTTCMRTIYRIDSSMHYALAALIAPILAIKNLFLIIIVSGFSKDPATFRGTYLSHCKIELIACCIGIVGVVSPDSANSLTKKYIDEDVNKAATTLLATTSTTSASAAEALPLPPRSTFTGEAPSPYSGSSTFTKNGPYR